MADNSTTPSSGGLPVGSDDIGSFQYQRVKLIHGADGVNDGDASRANPYPIQDTGIAADGIFKVSALTNTYAGLAASAPLIAWRWFHASKLCAILEVEVSVYTTTAASTAGITERQLVLARSWSVSDSGGTAVTFGTNDQKTRTAMTGTLMNGNGDFRVTSGGALTAGTRTLDANPFAAAFGWAPLNHTGVDISGGGGAATGAVWGTVGGHQGWFLHSSLRTKMPPIVFAQNEGFIVRVGQAMPGGATQRTAINITWAEGSAF